MMERSFRGFAPKGGSAVRALGVLGGFLALAAAATVGVVLVAFFAATAVVIAVLASFLLGVAGLVFRARRPAPVRGRTDLIEARRVGGHQWVAYGWDEARR